MRHFSKVKIGRAAVAIVLFLASIPANSSIAPLAANSAPMIFSAPVTNSFVKPTTATAPQIDIPMDISTATPADTAASPFAMINERTKELNLALLEKAAKVADAHKFNPADYVPYRSLNSNSTSQVPTKILAQTLQTFISRDTTADSIFNSPLVKNAGYTKSIEQKNYKISYGIHNTLAQTELQFHKNMTASLTYNLASPELNLGIHWSF